MYIFQNWILRRIKQLEKGIPKIRTNINISAIPWKKEWSGFIKGTVRVYVRAFECGFCLGRESVAFRGGVGDSVSR